MGQVFIPCPARRLGVVGVGPSRRCHAPLTLRHPVLPQALFAEPLPEVSSDEDPDFEEVLGLELGSGDAGGGWMALLNSPSREEGAGVSSGDDIVDGAAPGSPARRTRGFFRARKLLQDQQERELLEQARQRGAEVVDAEMMTPEQMSTLHAQVRCCDLRG